MFTRMKMTGGTGNIGKWMLMSFALLLLSACLLPEQFKARLDLDESGGYRFRYQGVLAFVPGIAELQQGGKTSAKLQKDLQSLGEELARDPDFRSVRYRGDGRYEVVYERKGKLDRPFHFIGKDTELFSLLLEENGQVELRSLRLREKDRRQLKALGLGMKGEFVVVTRAQVIEHNADTQERMNDGRVRYLWKIESLDANNLPAMRLRLN